jgi:PAS domain S-box-containing protein
MWERWIEEVLSLTSALHQGGAMSKRISLERSITSSVLSVGLLLGMVGSAYVYWYAKESLRYTLGTTFQELARQSADHIGLSLTREVEWIEGLSALSAIQSATRIGGRLPFNDSDLRRFQEHEGRYFTSMMLVDRNGHVVGGMTSGLTESHYRDQLWWSVVFDQGRAWAGTLSRDDTGRWHWEIAVPVRETTGSVIGALKVIIGKEDLLASILHSRIGDTGHVMLLDRMGTVLACAALDPALHIPVPLLELEDDPVGKGRAAPFSAVWKEVKVDTHRGQNGIIGVAPVRLRSDIAHEHQWVVLVQQAPDEMYAPLVTLMGRLALLGLAAVGCIALLRWRLARQIAAPINRLVERVRAWGQRESAPGRVEPVGIEEIDTLASSFEDLATRLASASRESQQYVCELEVANREIAQSEEHYRMLWNHSLHPRLLVDRQGIIQDLNRRGEIKFWKAAAKVVGMPLLSLFSEQDRLPLQGLLREVFTTGKERTAGELEIPAPTGDVFIMEVDLVPIEEHSVVAVVMVQLTDLTEKKQLQEQLLKSERLASLSQFASMFAHDIRNPLAGVKKTLELMAQRTELQVDPVRGWCEDLQYTIELLQGMINDMLDVFQEHYSGLPLITSAMSLNEVLREVARLFRLEADAREITLRLCLPDEEVTIAADRRRIERVLINLVHNALKYSPPRGVVTASGWVPSDGETPPRSLSDRGGSEMVCVSIEDDGPGIDPVELPHIFEMFFRHRNRGDGRVGRGLGLHFCRLVVDAHHGSIHAANRPDGGARFTVKLPVRDIHYADHVAHC